MRRAIDLANRGGKATQTNPKVGAVLVYKSRIIGEGWHQEFGSHHAESNALNSVTEKDIPFIAQSTMYVTLEPCSFIGKTGSCAVRLVNEKIKEVHIACLDPNPKVSGNGIKILEQQGITCHLGLLKTEAKDLIRKFEKNLQSLPYITLKWAQSSDNVMGIRDQQLWLSSPSTQIYNHKLRSQIDGILVGTNTVKTDNPSLTTREHPGDNPVRVILDRQLVLDHSYRVFDAEAKTIILNEKESYVDQAKNNHFVRLSNLDDIQVIKRTLFKAGLYHVLVEGGKQVLSSFIKAEAWDEGVVFRSEKNVKDKNSDLVYINSPFLKGRKLKVLDSGSDQIVHFCRT